MKKYRGQLLAIVALALAIGAPGHFRAQEEPANKPDPARALAKAGEHVLVGAYSLGLDPALVAVEHATGPAQKGRALLLAGYCDYRLGHYDMARERLKDVNANYPLLAYHALLYGARSYMDQEDYAEASKLLEKLVAADPPGDLKPRALMQLVRCGRKAEDPEKTADALKRLRSGKWTDSDWNRELEYTDAWIKLMSGDKAGARAAFLKMWKDHPESDWAGESEKFLTGEADISVLEPGESKAFTESDRIYRIKKLLDHHYPKQANSEVDPIVKSAEQNNEESRLADLYKLRGTTWMDQRSFKNAIADFERAQAKLGSESVELTYYKARCLQRGGDWTDAIEVYRHIYTSYPNSNYTTRALYYSARLLKLKNEWDAAEDNYKKLVSAYPYSNLKPESLFQIAWIRILKGDHAKALQYLEKVPRSSNDADFNARTYYWKSACLHKLGRHEEAKELEDYIIKRYWRSAYSFYLVLLENKKWPHQGGARPVPKAPASTPAEFNLAKELYLMGMTIDSQGQLTALEKTGGMSEGLAWSLARLYHDLDDYYLCQSTARRHLKQRLKSTPPAEKAAWQLAFPKAYEESVNKYAEHYKIDPYLVWSLMRAESTYRPTIRSSAGALGLMQIMPTTGKQIAKGLGDKGFSTGQLKDPETNMRYGCYYLGNRLEQFGNGKEDPDSKLNTIARALAAYNAGPNRSKRWGARADELGLSAPAFIEEIPIKETNDYVKRILGFYMVYHHTYESD